MKYSVTDDTITMVVDGGTVHVVHIGSANFDALRAALFEKRYGDIQDLISPAKMVGTWSQGDFVVDGGAIKHKGVALPTELNRRILAMVKEGADPVSLTRFWEKLQKNPSKRSVDQLFSFLVHEGIPITDEGDILAYKSVTAEYMDWRTGTFDNTPGTVNEMPRNKVTDDPSIACDAGLHVGSLTYAQSFMSGGRIVICRIDPADVVSVPDDNDAQKMRVCRYEVMCDCGSSQLPSTVCNASSMRQRRKPPDAGSKPAQAQRKSVHPGKKMTAREKQVYDAKGVLGLNEFPMDELRSFATNILGIAGASRIRGGKVKLMKVICDKRGF